MKILLVVSLLVVSFVPVSENGAVAAGSIEVVASPRAAESVAPHGWYALRNVFDASIRTNCCSYRNFIDYLKNGKGCWELWDVRPSPPAEWEVLEFESC